MTVPSLCYLQAWEGWMDVPIFNESTCYSDTLRYF